MSRPTRPSAVRAAGNSPIAPARPNPERPPQAVAPRSRGGWLRPGAAGLGVVLVLSACAELAPLRTPPLGPAEDFDSVNTREEAIKRFGPPEQVRSSDVGPVLVYRRVVVIDANPNRYYGEDRGNRLNQYELVLFYLDGEDRIVRRAIEPE